MRLDYMGLSGEASKSMFAISAAIRRSSLDAALRELVAVQISQLNGCAHCIAVHWGKARAAGVSERELRLLPAHEEAVELGVYNQTQAAALHVAREMTRHPERGLPDDVFVGAQELFGDETLMWLIQHILLMNSWNRLSIALRIPAPDAANPDEV